MKKLFLFLVIHTVMFANMNYELKLYEKVLVSIFKKQKLNVYVSNNIRVLLKNSDKFNIVNICDKSVDLLIGDKFIGLAYECKNKPLFSTSHKSFKNDKNSFGAFYWRKGRPQIIFNQDVLDNYKLVLPDSLKRYVK